MLTTLLPAALAGLLAAAPPAPPRPDHGPACKAWLEGARDAPPPTALAPSLQVVDVLHYDLHLEVLPQTAELIGGNTITARSLVNGLGEIELRLDDAFTVTWVQSGQIPASWQRQSGTTITVNLDHPMMIGEVFDVFVSYEGHPSSGGFGSINFASRGGEPLVYTLSEPWYAYTWWPAKDDNYDKATGELTITVPDPLTVAANGVLMEETDLGDGRRRYAWATAYDTATYLFSFSAALYNRFDGAYAHDGGEMPVEFFIFPDSDTSFNRNQWLKSVDMLEVFASIYGPYPFLAEKYGIYQFGFGGGMEHQTMTGQGGFGTSLTAHELAHQWWGDMVTCGTWQDIWLNEGFATYGEALWEQYRPGSTGEPALRSAMNARRPSNPGAGSVWIPEDEATSVNRIFSGNLSYRKGAWALHQLRHVVGDEAFFEMLAQYRAAFEYGAATTADLQAVAENVHGADLDWFFDEWVYGIGAPAYGRAWVEHDGPGGRWVELLVRQVQVEQPFFTMPLDVRLVTTAGNVTYVVRSDAAEEHFLLPLADDLLTVELDPDDWVLVTDHAIVAWEEGPPKIVATSPAPGASVPASDLAELTVTFHESVDAPTEGFSLVGDVVGPVELVPSLSPDAFVATLTLGGALPPDAYTLTVGGGIVDTAGQLALDGEIADPADPASLPSGDGRPGGQAVLRFTVTGLPGDANGDGVVDVDDLLLVITSWGACPGPPDACPGDVTGDGVVDVEDLVEVILGWTEG